MRDFQFSSSPKRGLNDHVRSDSFAFLPKLAALISEAIGKLFWRPVALVRRNGYRLLAVTVVFVICWSCYGVYMQRSILAEARALLPSGGCPVVDNKNTLDIGQAIHDFVQYEMPKNPDYDGIYVYPWVLTMTAALRFGGNAVFDGEDLFLVDHDVDIRFSRATEIVDPMLGARLQADMVAYVGKQCGMWVWFEESKHPGGHGTAFLLRMSDFSQMGWWAISSGVARILSERIRKQYDDQYGDIISYVMHIVAKAIDTSWIRNLIAGPASAHVTVIDFHTKPEVPVPPHPSRRVKWAGRSFPYPEDESHYVRHFDRYVGRYHPDFGLGVFDVCDLYDPQLRWPDDSFSNSTRKYDILEKCGDQLEREGFYNLNHCRDYDPSMHPGYQEPTESLWDIISEVWLEEVGEEFDLPSFDL